MCKTLRQTGNNKYLQQGSLASLSGLALNTGNLYPILNFSK